MATPNKSEWHRYYSPKRAPQQHGQLDLIARTDGRRVLEIGPYLGYVTALLVNAGYEVDTFDFGPRQFAHPATPHHEGDLRTFNPERFAGIDTIVCCETLEHIEFSAAQSVLGAFAQTGARNLIVSVPWSGFHMWAALHSHGKGALHVKWPNRWRRFEPEADPFGHKWEVGYRDTPLKLWEASLRSAGWRIIERRFTTPIRSVMHLCINALTPWANGT